MSAMLGTGDQNGPWPKCFFTHSVLPAFVDHDQPSRKKKPFSTIHEHAFTNTASLPLSSVILPLTLNQIDIVVPHTAHKTLLEGLKVQGKLQYAKVYMKLSDVVEGDFFNDYIKTGGPL